MDIVFSLPSDVPNFSMSHRVRGGASYGGLQGEKLYDTSIARELPYVARSHVFFIAYTQGPTKVNRMFREEKARALVLLM